ncbi:MAG: hypothetical protein WCF26_15800 [Candidatus Sulfotelmatobacter sp.]
MPYLKSFTGAAPITALWKSNGTTTRKFLEQAFISTYGFDIHLVLGRARPALRSYRTSVRTFIPAFAEAEVVLHRHQFPPHPDDEAYRTFAERVARTNYERHWKHAYKGPGIRAHLLAVFVFLVPKIGAASDLALKIPTPKTEEWYLQSVNHTSDVFRETLHKHLSDPDPRVVLLPNLDLDTGSPAKLGDYALADQTYEQLLLRLTSKPPHSIPADLKQNILDYYASLESANDANDRLRQVLATIKAMKPASDLR